MTLDLTRPILGHPDGVTRRRFLGGTLATVGAATVVPTWLAEAAGAATPVAATDGIVVIVTLGGGNDGLNTLTPIAGTNRSQYEQLRGAIALPAASLLPAEGDLGFNPALTRLAARYAQGKVAVVQGTGQTNTLDLSHFTSMGTVMAGTASSTRTTGWLGRYLDGVTEWDSGLRGVSLGTTMPLHLVGTRAKVTGMPSDGNVWGADTSASWERSAHDAVRAMAGAATGLGAMADRSATVQKDAVDQAAVIGGVLQPAPTVGGFAGELTLAARLLNAGLGTRVVAATIGGWDTHAGQLNMQAERLGQLDVAIEAFFQELRPEVAAQTAMVVVSEFGRRASVNGSQGTDHGSAGHMLVIGDKVRGGLHGAYPSLTALDSSGSLVPTVDFRSVYATVVERWLAGDANAIVGGSYERLDLFHSTPGA
jgi:uncharacterized protein (DUF1501 family)